MTKISFDTAAYTLAISGNEVKIDADKLAGHAAVCEYIFKHGIKQMLGDAFSTHKGSAEEKLAQAMKKLDSLYEGKAVQERLGGDPVAREMREMAEADVKAKVVAAGKKWADIAKETKAKVIAAQLEKNAEAYRKAAVAKLAIKPKMAEGDDDDIMSLLEG
jgi:hypothetical protein